MQTLKPNKYIVGQKLITVTGIEIKIMAYSDGYYMVRRKGCYPFVKSDKELELFIAKSPFNK